MSLAYLNRPNQNTSAWTEEVIVAMSEWWADGLSCSLVAKKLNETFGTVFTTNAVVGKIDRLGLPKRKMKTGAYGLRSRAPRVSAPEISAISDNAIPIEQRKTLYQLGPHDCRWPVGDPLSDLFFFCGGAVEEGRPYCAGHWHRSYEPRKR